MRRPDPPIFHITHVDNLAGVLAEGGLWCDRQRIERGLGSTNIGHRHIKNRRLQRAVPTKDDTTLGDYVPFNFCPRSVMLYAIHKGHRDFVGGQEHIVHLVSAVSSATSLGRAWAFTDRHAELAHALYFDDLARLDEVAWHAMAKRYWAEVREERQAEFLVHEFFPWTAIREIATYGAAVAERVRATLQGPTCSTHAPTVSVRPEWYY